MLNILLSNDDGVHADGINILYQELSKYFNVTVMAPDRNCSGASSSLTLLTPLRAEKLSNGFYSVNGTPTDCVHLGLSELITKKPDIVVSGINNGENLGDDTLYSGTLAAAIAGRHLDLTSLAVSLAGKNENHYETAAIIARKIIQKIVDEPSPLNQILNLNVPDLPITELAGVKVTKLGHRHQAEAMQSEKDTWHREVFWYGKLGQEKDNSEGTDFHALNEGFASLTPITIDMTAIQQIKPTSEWLKNTGKELLNG
jgi:5'-nucleotidase